jgi:hypothetical protein
MENIRPGLLELSIKTIIVHTVTYMLMGLWASTYMNYKEAYAVPYMACWMRQFGDPLLTAGPLFQPLRGIVFALAFYPLRDIFFGKKNGWAVIFWVLVAIGILAPFGPPPGSIEGMVYTVIPLSKQVSGYIEIIPQAFLLSVGLFYWINHPEKKWLNWLFGFLFFLSIIFPVLGVVAG